MHWFRAVWYQRVAVRGVAVAAATTLPLAGAMVMAFTWDRDASRVSILAADGAVAATPVDAHSGVDASHADGHEHESHKSSSHDHAADAEGVHTPDGEHGHHDGAAAHDRNGHGNDGAEHAHDGNAGHHAATAEHAHAGGGAPFASHDHPLTTNGSPSHPAEHGGGHGHPSPPGSSAPPSHEHPSGPITSLDDPRLTAAQRAAAKSLIDRTKTGMKPFGTVGAVTAAGYVWIGDGRNGGYRHYVHWKHLSDGRALDPAHVESIVTQKNADGSEHIVSAMYILDLGKTMADVPEIAGSLTTWHDHKNLCWNGQKLAGRLVNGKCTPGGVNIVTPPMLHVWLVPHPCGPFAGIEGHGQGCAHDH
jgi:hypothetical protein